MKSAGPAAGSVDSLSVSLVALQNKRAEMVAKYQPTDPLVQQIDRQIENTKEGLQRAQKMAAREVATDANPLYDSSARDLSSSTVALSAAKARSKNLTAQIQMTSTRKSARVESASTQYEVLAGRVVELENSYKDISSETAMPRR